VDWAVIVIGINRAQQAEDLPPEIQEIATSLSMAAGSAPDQNLLIGAMLRALHTMSDSLLTARQAVMARYRRDCVTIGKEIAVHRFDEVRHGTAQSVADDGSLVVRYPDGTVQSVSAGEVSVRGMYGYI
jgi:BirA family biotin operon repressor/biotin-[acetyl-CoA-carboxylase] ligase